MHRVAVITRDAIVKALLEYMVRTLPDMVLEEPADVVLLDAVQMSRLSEYPAARVILFSADADPRLLWEAREAGAACFWYLKPSPEELERVICGEPTIPDQPPSVPLGAVESDTLTLRELEVLQQIVEGKTDVQIADALILSVPTVKHHIQQLRLKTGLANRTQLAVSARDSGLVARKV